MDHKLECLIDTAFANQSPMLVDAKYQVSTFPTQASPDTNTIRAVTQPQDKQSTLKREQVRKMPLVQNKQKKVTVRPPHQGCYYSYANNISLNMYMNT